MDRTFSGRARQELIDLPLGEDCCARAEVAGFLAAGTQRLSDHSTARRHQALLALTEHKTYAGGISLRRECCKRAYVRGGFLGGGSVTNPEKAYHIEILVRVGRAAQDMQRIIGRHDLSARITRRTTGYAVYIKDSEGVAGLLAMMGAHEACLSVESVRVDKDMRIGITRQVNCDAFNLKKTIEASARSIDSLNRLRNKRMLHMLSTDVLNVATMRERHPEVTMRELGAMFAPPLGASVINRRLKRLDEIAKSVSGSVIDSGAQGSQGQQ